MFTGKLMVKATVRRVGQFIGDLKSLEGLSQALVEGSAAAAKVVFTVSPSSTTKPSTLAAAGNGAIIQGRPMT